MLLLSKTNNVEYRGHRLWMGYHPEQIKGLLRSLGESTTPEQIAQLNSDIIDLPGYVEWNDEKEETVLRYDLNQ